MVLVLTPEDDHGNKCLGIFVVVTTGGDEVLLAFGGGIKDVAPHPCNAHLTSIPESGPAPHVNPS